jgi:hypothetical protein
MTHGKRGFLQEAGELALDHLCGAEMSTLLNNKNFLESGRCE